MLWRASHRPDYEQQLTSLPRQPWKAGSNLADRLEGGSQLGRIVGVKECRRRRGALRQQFLPWSEALKATV